MRGRWHGGAVTDEVGILRLRITVHLISQPAADSFPYEGKPWGERPMCRWNVRNKTI